MRKSSLSNQYRQRSRKVEKVYINPMVQSLIHSKFLFFNYKTFEFTHFNIDWMTTKRRLLSLIFRISFIPSWCATWAMQFVAADIKNYWTHGETCWPHWNRLVVIWYFSTIWTLPSPKSRNCWGDEMRHSKRIQSCTIWLLKGEMIWKRLSSKSEEKR